MDFIVDASPQLIPDWLSPFYRNRWCRRGDGRIYVLTVSGDQAFGRGRAVEMDLRLSNTPNPTSASDFVTVASYASHLILNLTITMVGLENLVMVGYATSGKNTVLRTRFYNNTTGLGAASDVYTFSRFDVADIGQLIGPTAHVVVNSVASGDPDISVTTIHFNGQGESIMGTTYCRPLCVKYVFGSWSSVFEIDNFSGTQANYYVTDASLNPLDTTGLYLEKVVVPQLSPIPDTSPPFTPVGTRSATGWSASQSNYSFLDTYNPSTSDGYWIGALVHMTPALANNFNCLFWYPQRSTATSGDWYIQSGDSTGRVLNTTDFTSFPDSTILQVANQHLTMPMAIPRGDSFYVISAFATQGQPAKLIKFTPVSISNIPFTISDLDYTINTLDSHFLTLGNNFAIQGNCSYHTFDSGGNRYDLGDEVAEIDYMFTEDVASAAYFKTLTFGAANATTTDPFGMMGFFGI